MTKIHASAIVSESAVIGLGVEIGAFCVVGDGVKIGDNTVLKSHVVVEGDTEIGSGNVIFPFAVIGEVPQDLKFAGEKSRIVIGNNNRIREHVTIHPGTKDGGMLTQIGNNCLLMVATHVAHDCVIGNRVILANNATLAGHVQVGDDVVVGGLSAVHQFARIGRGAMIGGMSGVEGDVIPYGLVMGERASLAGLNLVGMKRQNLEREDIHQMRNFFKKVFEETDGNFVEKVQKYAPEFDSKVVNVVVDFINSQTSRQFCQMKKG